MFLKKIVCTFISYVFATEKNKQSGRKFGSAFCSFVFTATALIFSSQAYSITAEEELQRRFYDSSEAEYSLSNSPFYLSSSSASYLYEGFEGTESLDTFDGTAYFIEQLKKANIDAFPNATWIPIAGDITFFIQSIGTLPKRVGTPYVEKGLIKSQITELLKRSWIGGYATVEAQAKALAEHGVAFGVEKGLTFGHNLSLDEIQNVSEDMIWPEIRNIHGKEVLVPVVYLPQSTFTDQVIDGNTLSFGSANLNYETVSIDGAKVETLRGLMIDVKDSFINQNGTIVAGEVDIKAGQDISNLSGTISGDTVRLTANNIENRTLVIRHNYAYGYNEHADTLAVIESVGDLTINTTKNYLDEGGNLLNQGAQIIAGGYLDVEAGGNIQIVSQPVSDYHSQSGSFWSQTTSSSQNLRSQLSGSDITLFAHESLVIEGASIESPGMIELLANMGLYIVESIDSKTFEYTFEVKAGGLGGSVYTSDDISETEERQKTEILQTIITAGRDVAIRSNGTTEYGGDVVLRAIDLSAGGDLEIIAQNGAVYLNVAKDLDYYSYTFSRESILTFEMSGEGHQIETGYYNQLLNQGVLTIDGATGVYVDYVLSDEANDLQSVVDELSATPGFAWINDMQTIENGVEWSEVQLAFDEWDYEAQGLTKAGAALVAIAVSFVAGPAADGILNAMLHAGAVAIDTQVINSLYSTGFDLGETFDELGSSQNINSLVTSVLTAGALEGLGGNFNAFDSGVDGGLNPIQQSINWASNAIAQSVITTGVQGAVYGFNSDEYESVFLNSVGYIAIQTIGQKLAGKIGDLADDNKINTAIQYIAHAGAGCLGGLLTAELDDDLESEFACASAAGGAVIGELIASNQREKAEEKVVELMDEAGQLITDALENPLFEHENGILGFSAEVQTQLQRDILSLKSRGIDISRLGAGLIAAGLGGDVSLAAEYGGIAAEFNAFSDFGFNDPKTVLVELGRVFLAANGLHTYGTIETYSDVIFEAASAHGVDPMHIASIIFQEKYTGLGADGKNAMLAWPQIWLGGNSASIGLAEMDINTAAGLLGLDASNLTDSERDWVIGGLSDNEAAIHLIAVNVARFRDALGREVTLQEATFGHNSGLDVLIRDLPIVEGGFVSRRSWGFQDEIREALYGE